MDFVIFACIKKHFSSNINQTVFGWCLISCINQNTICLMFDIKRQLTSIVKLKLQLYFGAVITHYHKITVLGYLLLGNV